MISATMNFTCVDLKISGPLEEFEADLARIIKAIRKEDRSFNRVGA